MTNQSRLAIYCFGGTLFLILGVNLAQYLLGLESGSVDSTFEYGLPFAYYEYVPLLSRGRVLYLGGLGDLLTAIGIGAITTIAISRLKWGGM